MNSPTWESITQRAEYQKGQDTYYFQSQQLVDSMHRAFFAQLELQNKEVNAKIFKGASATAIIVYRILVSLLVQPLKNLSWQTRQDQAVQSLLQADPVLKSAYTYAMKHVTHQIVQVINPKETSIKHAENLILLNQVNMEGKFGRNCRKLTAQINYLFCDNNGCIDFAKFNDKATNAQAIKLMEEFFRFTADDHEIYVDYCRTAAQNGVPGMQAIVTQASQGTRFSIGQSNFSKWKEQVLGATRHAIDPIHINAQKLNRDFLALIGHLRANEFDPQADMNLNYWKAWQLRSKYMRLADSIVDPTLKSKVHEQAIVMHNLFGDYYHKNRAKYNCWDTYNCEVYIDQAGVLRVYPKTLNALTKQYGFTRTQVLHLSRAYNLSPESLAEICADQSKKTVLEQLAKEVKTDYGSKIAGRSLVIKDLITYLKAKQNQCIGHEPEIFIRPDSDEDIDKPYFPPAPIGHMPPIGGNLPEYPICPGQDIPEIPKLEPDDISIPHPEEDCIWSKTQQLPPIVGATVGHGDGGPEIDPEGVAEASTQTTPEIVDVPEDVDVQPKAPDEVDEAISDSEDTKEVKENPTYVVPAIDENKNGLYITEKELKIWLELIKLIGPDGQIMKLNIKHNDGGTLEDGKLTGLHIGKKLKELVEKGYIILKDADFSEIFDIPDGCSYYEWKPAGEEFESVEFKGSTGFGDLDMHEIAKLITEAWEDVMLHQQENIKKITKDYTQPMKFVKGKTKSGIEIAFNLINFKKGTIQSIYPLIIEKDSKNLKVS